MNHEILPMIVPMTRRTIGAIQSEWRKVRSIRAFESGCGATHAGMRPDIPNCLAAGD